MRTFAGCAVSDEDSFDLDRLNQLTDTQIINGEDDLRWRLLVGCIRDMALNMKSIHRILTEHVVSCANDRNKLNTRLKEGRTQMAANTNKLGILEERTGWLVWALAGLSFLLGCVVTKMIERVF